MSTARLDAPTSADVALLDEVIRALAPLERAAGSPGEREAAEWIAGRLDADGFRVQIDTHPIHGNFWRPIGALGALVALAGVAALRGRRKTGAALAALAGAGLVDEITCRTYLPRRLLGRRKTTPNVVAERGDPDAPYTIVFMAHHDAAQSGLVFHPGPQRFIAKRFPKLIEANDTAPPMWWPAFTAPVLVALGALTGRTGVTKTGIGMATGTVLSMADIGRHATVPGANDNLTGVAVLVALARRLHDRPVENVRVILVSAGAEETLQEGIRGFADKHFKDLPRERTRFVNVDTVGCPILVLLEAEGALRMEEYDEEFKDQVAGIAERIGVPLRRGMRARTSTDSVVPMRAGYPIATLVSMNAHKALDNYHWPTDVPDNVELGTVAGALEICDAVVREFGTEMDVVMLDGSAKPRLRGVSHKWAFFASLVTGTALVLLAPTGEATVASLIYALSVTGLFGVSGLYHRTNWKTPNARRWMKRLDHSMIFLLIAGTYTPMALLALDGTMATVILIVVWSGALAGIVLKLVWIDAPKWLVALAYVALGWVAVAAFPQLLDSLGITGTVLVGVGGILYSVGALTYAIKRPDPVPKVFGYHEVFHVLVILAAALHYSVVAFYVLPGSG